MRRIHVTPFGRTRDGRDVRRFSLANGRRMRVDVASYGAVVLSVVVPDREGTLGDVVLGYDDLEGYERDRYYVGGVVGRYANRIAGGRLLAPDGERRLTRNDGLHHLHGGVAGFHRAVWNARTMEAATHASVELSLESPDGDEGYPGRLDARVVYTLTDEGALSIDYQATTDWPTVVNLTQHSYFNLTGAPAEGILDHELALFARRFTPIDEGLIPTGELRSVEGTLFDFLVSRRIGDRIDRRDDAQIRTAGGYDHNWVVDGPAGRLRPAARLRCPRTGRVLDVSTTEPGIQLYTGNALASGLAGKGGTLYGPRSGLCLETQHFPDSPNHPAFPSAWLYPGEVVRSTTVLRFSTDGAATSV